MTYSLGIDLGTSGIRCAVIDEGDAIIGMSRGSYPDETAMGWWVAVTEGLQALRDQIGDAAMGAIQTAAIDGTSGSMVLIDADLTPATEPLMYFSGGFEEEAAHIAQFAPEGDITRGPSSALARVLRLQSMDTGGAARYLCHQADFILAKLTGQPGHSDENNALKTGFDVAARRWPAWISKTDVIQPLLPNVHPAGTFLATISPDVADSFGLNPALRFHAGTTDSIAAFLATGASNIGDVVTSLGTTLAIKMLSDVRIDDAAQGIYSHRLNDAWLVGGASNTGGGALLAHFDIDTLNKLSGLIDPNVPTNLNYYPLPRTGERFPVNDPNKPSVTTPRPSDDVTFLQGLLEGIARIEFECYQSLAALGAPPITRIFSAGGGAGNKIWTKLRQTQINIPFLDPIHDEAAVGAARLARINA